MSSPLRCPKSGWRTKLCGSKQVSPLNSIMNDYGLICQCSINVHVKRKVKVFAVHSMNTCSESRLIVPHFLNLSARLRWVATFTHWSLYHLERTPAYCVGPTAVWAFSRKSLIPAGVRTPDRLARSPVAVPIRCSCFISVRFLYFILKLYRLLEYTASSYCGTCKWWMLKDMEGIDVAHFKMLLRPDTRLFVVPMLRMNWVIILLLHVVDSSSLAFITTWGLRKTTKIWTWQLFRLTLGFGSIWKCASLSFYPRTKRDLDS